MLNLTIQFTVFIIKQLQLKTHLTFCYQEMERKPFGVFMCMFTCVYTENFCPILKCSMYRSTGVTMSYFFLWLSLSSVTFFPSYSSLSLWDHIGSY